MNMGLYIVQQVINAVSLGSLYALVAIGLSMVFGILRMTNFAHGDMMMVGAFATLVLGFLGIPFWLAAVGGIVVAALVGILVERVAYRPVRGSADVTLLLTSLAYMQFGFRSAFYLFRRREAAKPATTRLKKAA